MNVYGNSTLRAKQEANSKVVQMVNERPPDGLRYGGVLWGLAFTAFPLSCLFSGGRGRNRTYNLSVKSRMLCQLSYASIQAGCAMLRRFFAHGVSRLRYSANL